VTETWLPSPLKLLHRAHVDSVVSESERGIIREIHAPDPRCEARDPIATQPSVSFFECSFEAVRKKQNTGQKASQRDSRRLFNAPSCSNLRQ
jgi:hypothetical protein